MTKHDGSPACVSQSAAGQLSDRGWSYVPDVIYWEKDSSIVSTFDYVIEHDSVTYGSQYEIAGGTVDQITYDAHCNSLIVPLDESEKGYIQIVTQTGLLHSLGQAPFTYMAIIDGTEVAFDQLSPIVLKIPFEKGANKIEIVGVNEI